MEEEEEEEKEEGMSITKKKSKQMTLYRLLLFGNYIYAVKGVRC